MAKDGSKGLVGVVSFDENQIPMAKPRHIGVHGRLLSFVILYF